MPAPPPDAIPAHDRPAYFRPVIPLLFALMAGILGARFGPAWGLWIAGPTGVTALGAAVYALIWNKPAKIAPLLLFACLGYFLLFTWNAEKRFADHVSHYIETRSHHIIGTIVESPMASRFRQTCFIDDLEITPAKREPYQPVRGKIRVSIYGTQPQVKSGDRIAFFSEIRPFTNFKNPGAFDYRQHMADRGIWGTTYTATHKLSIHADASKAGLNPVEALRDRLAGQIARAADGDSRALLMALLLGERRRITDELREAFNRAGVSHILAISGLHVGIVATTAFFGFKWLLSFATPLLFLGWSRKGAALLAIGPVIFYGLLAGMSPSTQRAVIMISIFLMTFLLEKDHDIFNTLAAAGLIILTINPPALFSVSFQLSFAAVLSILYGLEKTAKGQQGLMARVPGPLRPILGFTWVTCLAIIGTAPVIMHYFNQLPVFGILSNLIIVPLIGFISVPTGLLSIAALNPVNADAAVLGLRLSAWFLDVSVGIIDLIARCPFSAIKTVTPSLLEIICYYMLLWCLLNLRRPTDASLQLQAPPPGTAGMGSDPTWRHNWLSGRNRVFPVIALTLMLAAGNTAYWLHKRFFDDSLRVTVLDVGQGSAALLELPRGACVLIDGGGFSDNTVFDLGRWVLAPYLWRNKIRTVDAVILSHPDADHVNGLVYILTHFRVGRIFSTHEPGDHDEYRKFADLIREKNIFHPDFQDLSRSFIINGVAFDVLSPPVNFMDPDVDAPWRNSNNNSLVLRITHGNQAILFPGDIMADAERELIAMHPQELKSAVLVAPHHGSRTSSTAGFLDAVNPRAVIISSGRPDTFPAPEVLEQYEHRALPILRTDSHGAVRITSDGRRLTCKPMVGKPLILRSDPAYMEIDPLR